MKPMYKFIYWVFITLSFVATAVSVGLELYIGSEHVSFAIGLSCFLIVLIFYLFAFVVTFMLSFKYGMSKWPLWFALINPLLGMLIFTCVNWKAIHQVQVAEKSSK